MEFEKMKILVLNCGSSSIKCYLYNFTGAHHLVSPLWQAHLQWKNSFEEPRLTIEKGKEKHSEPVKGKTAAAVLKQILRKHFADEQVDVIGHRIVHGGRYFKESVLITREVKEKIRELSDLAPLHNLSELEGIEILEEHFKNTPQVAVFDTAFHRTLPKATEIYPGPYRWYEEGIQRYGFHGISFQYCSRRAREILNRDLKSLKMVICHLGAGASLCAIKEGKSIDTTMGFTPLEGLMMDTRSGSIDPGIILYLLRKKKSLKQLSQELYNESGLLGISGVSSDMRDIIEKSERGDPRATLALEIYIHRLNALIGAMVAALRGVDVLVFTAGIGENASLLRDRVCDAFSFLGVTLDKTKNNQSSPEDRDLSKPDSKVKVLLIHTQEAFEIARECFERSHNLD